MKRAEHRALGDTLGQGGSGGGADVDVNYFFPAFEIWVKPGENNACDVEGLKAWEYDGVVDGVEGGCKVKKDEDGE